MRIELDDFDANATTFIWIWSTFKDTHFLDMEVKQTGD